MLNLNPAQMQYAQYSYNMALDMGHPDPGGFVAKIYAESRFNPLAVSPKGARGIAQIMPATEKQLGVDAMIPEQAIPASIRYDLMNYKPNRGESALPMMYASYNAGPGRAAEALQSFKETQDYVVSIDNNRAYFENMASDSPYVEDSSSGIAYGGEGITETTSEAVDQATTGAAAPTESAVSGVMKDVFGFGKEQANLSTENWLARGAMLALGATLENKANDKARRGKRSGRGGFGMAPGTRVIDPFNATAGYRPVKSILGGDYRLV